MEKRQSRSKQVVTPEAAFASVLRELRHRRGVSQEGLGFDTGYHRTYISMLERGMMNPSLRTVLSLAAALQTTGSDIVGRVEARLPKGHVLPWKDDR